jgi:hypothetical protein
MPVIAIKHRTFDRILIISETAPFPQVNTHNNYKCMSPSNLQNSPMDYYDNNEGSNTQRSGGTCHIHTITTSKSRN